MLVALAAFLGTAAVCHRLLPFPAIDNITPKLRFFAAHKDEWDTLFVGTSRFEHQLEPEIFDRQTARGGRPTRSFNLSVDGMHPPENFYVLEQVLKEKPRHLKWIVLEFGDIESRPGKGAADTRRFVYWHDWPRTSLVLRRIVNPTGNGRWYAKLFRAASHLRDCTTHLAACAKNFSNLGRAAELLNPSDDQADWPAQLGPRADGFRPPRAPMPASRVADYQRKLEREISNAHPRFLDPYAEGSFRHYAAAFARLGAQAVFVVPPVATQSPLRFRPAPAPPGPLLLFNDIRAYPELYPAAIRVDEGHLSQAGADEWTRLFAREFIRHAGERR